MREMCHYLACKNRALESHASEVFVTASSTLAPLVLSVCIVPNHFYYNSDTDVSCQNSVCVYVEGEGPVCLNCQ